MPAYRRYMLARAISGRKPAAMGCCPLNPIVFDSDSIESRTLKSLLTCHKCLEWLDRQPLNSVLYVSFGTTTTLSDEEINELAIGLEYSEQKFIWVLREADRGHIYADYDEEVWVLPEAWPMHSDQPWNDVLITEVLRVGLVVREWASRGEVASSTVIESAVRKLMVLEDGKDMRRRVEELSVTIVERWDLNCR
ncbi:UDP-glucuronosyl/UDP-glucosyltransferase [Macleaya cordata]|uniref:UDP-glucuronosyl/UDP-glucosyltransferase n=1 Tax=Macleaya cordata TaxID=56857 RepID=A0A200R715_MACCD|nr:UDP-glucuronosyl/UDP-glucosyltransferase [Macleaya cordata]